MAEQLYGLTKERRDELLRLLDWWQNVRGSGIRNTPWGMSQSLPRGKRRREPSPPREWLWVKITGYTSAGNNKWYYSWVEVQRTATGWEEVVNGRTGTTDTRYAINSIEANNSSSGIQGNSIDHDGADYPAGFAMQPVRGRPVVQLWIGVDTDGGTTYTFSYINAEDGTCT